MYRMPNHIHAYAAHQQQQPLQPYYYSCSQLADDQVLIAISHCGVCRSDLHFLNNDWGDSHYPVVPGHEIVGDIVACGDQVNSVSVGQVVGVSWQVGSCCACYWCQNQREEFCEQLKGLGMNQPGGFADYIVVDARFVVQLPKLIPREQAAVFMCAGLTSYNAIRVGGCDAGDHVAIIGIGGLGHIAIQIAKAKGCFVTAFIDNTKQASAVSNLGADQVVESCQLGAIESQQFDVIINTVDELGDYDDWLAALKPMGRFVFVSIPTKPFQCDLFPLAIAEKSIVAIPAGNQQLLKEWIDFAQQFSIKACVESLPMSQVNHALRRLQRGDVQFRFVLENEGPT